MLRPISFDRTGGANPVVAGAPGESGGGAREARLLARAGIAAVDALLEILERRHDASGEALAAETLRCRRDLESGDLAVPNAVSSATTGAQLAESLLDWQEELLRVAYPRRAGPILVGGRASYGGCGPRVLRHRWHQAARRPPLRPAKPCPHLTVVSDVEQPKGPEGLKAGRQVDGLTEREVTVLQVVSEGLTNAQVASRLHLSEHTVAAHLRSIFRKTDVASRSGATRYALEHGLT
jgi:DNA-binding CsgD family transcriptional regulator